MLHISAKFQDNAPAFVLKYGDEVASVSMTIAQAAFLLIGHGHKPEASRMVRQSLKCSLYMAVHFASFLEDVLGQGARRYSVDAAGVYPKTCPIELAMKLRKAPHEDKVPNAETRKALGEARELRQQGKSPDFEHPYGVHPVPNQTKRDTQTFTAQDLYQAINGRPRGGIWGPAGVIEALEDGLNALLPNVPQGMRLTVPQSMLKDLAGQAEEDPPFGIGIRVSPADPMSRLIGGPVLVVFGSPDDEPEPASTPA